MAASAETANALRGGLGGLLSRDKYIVSPLFDWVFLIGSPLLAIAVVLGAVQFLPKVEVEAYVLTYMALGHHVPTFLRAYGDPAEFDTNRFKLITMPAVVVPLLLVIYLLDSRLLLLIFIWDQYHFVRQHYGFMRLYDAKVGNVPTGRYNLDQLLSFSAFICIITYSDFYSYVYTGTLYDIGLAFPPWIGSVLQQGSLTVTAILGILYVLDIQRRWAQGENIALLKLVIFATTYGVWYYAYVTLSDPLLSYSISSFFHCLQYDAFAWYYNQKKARSMEQNRGNLVFRYLHRSRLLPLYVLAVFGYGFLSSTIGPVAPGVVYFVNRTTGILHYYFDSFIWRVRRAEFRKHL
jgi:hypothetical protein